MNQSLLSKQMSIYDRDEYNAHKVAWLRKKTKINPFTDLFLKAINRGNAESPPIVVATNPNDDRLAVRYNDKRHPGFLIWPPTAG